jgi:hypothetical protein
MASFGALKRLANSSLINADLSGVFGAEPGLTEFAGEGAGVNSGLGLKPSNRSAASRDLT